MYKQIDIPENTSIATRLQNVQDRMQKAAQAAGRNPASIELIAVSKTHEAEAIAEAFAAGHRVFGENYVQEALAKQDKIHQLIPESAQIAWHFLGHVQKNKAKDIAGRFALIHSLDSPECACILARRLPENIPQQSILLQINIGNEPQKAGLTEEALMPLFEALAELPQIDVQGLMCLPPFFDGGEKVRPYFARMQAILENMRQKTQLALPTLSMGMSGDFSIAIEEGATCIRVGSDIFGARKIRL